MFDVEYTFQQKLDAIQAYYAGNPVWEGFNLENATYQQINYMFSQIPQRQLMTDISGDGTVLGFGYADPVNIVVGPNIAENVNSNINPGQYALDSAFTPRFNGTFEYDSDLGQYYIKTGAKNGLGQTVSTVAQRVNTAVTCVNVAAKLGRLIDEKVYNWNPEFWDRVMPTVNPETWTSMAGSQNGKNFIRTLFGIADGGMTAYVQEETLAYVYQCLRDSGVWTETGQIIPGEISAGQMPLSFVSGPLGVLSETVFGCPCNPENPWFNTIGIFGWNDGRPTIWTSSDPSVNPNFADVYNVSSVEGGVSYTANHRFWDTSMRLWEPNRTNTDMSYYGSSSGQPYFVNNTEQTFGNVLFTGDMLPHMPTSEIAGSTQFPPTNITGTTPQEVLQQLKQQYPQLFQNPIHEDVLQPDGSLKTFDYVPVPWCDPNTQTSTQPTTGTTLQTDVEIKPETGDKLLDKDKLLPPDNQFPDTGTGQSPEVAPISGDAASSLWAVYNPTHSELSAFGSWLWSSDFIEQLKKLFNDPMQAIIGIHKVFATPHTNGRETIKCGYIDSGVSANKVSNQYTTVNCGSVSLREYFGNVMDYSPYTSVRVYLPFIGIVPLNVADIMRSTISIKYHVDVITGACVAEISVKRDGKQSVIYTYSGSAIVSYPISSGSYAGVIQGALSIAAGLIGGANAIPTVIKGAANMHADTSISGSFSGAPGAMGCKKPYLIISRPISNLAKDDSAFEGYPSSAKVLIGDCVGFIKCYEVHLRINTASDAELDEIRQLLLSGVRLTSANDGGTYADPSYLPIIPLNAYENGVYNADGYLRGYAPVTVNVQPNLENVTITENGTYSHPDYDGYDNVIVNVPSGAIIEPITIRGNGVYNPPSNVDGYAPVTVNVEGGGFSTDIKVENDALVYDNTEINVTSQPVIVDGEIGASGSAGLVFNVIPTFDIVFEFDYTPASGGGEHVLSFGGSNTNSGCIVIRPTQFLYFANGNRISQSISLSVGTQYHIKVIVTTSKMQMYVDGSLIVDNRSTYCQNIITYIFGKNAIGLMFNQSAHAEYNHGKMNNFRMYFET